MNDSIPHLDLEAASRILCVDDEDSVLEALQHLMFDEEWTVLVARDGKEALALLETTDVALVLSDYRMPGMNGVELLKAIRERHPQTVRMMLSGYAEAYVVVEAINEGAVERFLGKPWDDDELLRALREGMQKFRLVAENELLQQTIRLQNEKLQLANATLERKVKERTAELEMQNCALMFAQEVFDQLPAVLFGIDRDKNIMAMNDLARSFETESGLPELDNSLRDYVPAEVLTLIDASFAEVGLKSLTLTVQEKTYWVDCKPLGETGERGAIVVIRAQPTGAGVP